MTPRVDLESCGMFEGMSPPRRLHIAYAIDTFDDVKTGGVISAKRFISALRERHEVTLIAGGPSGDGRVGLPRFTVPPFGRVMREMGFVFAWPSRAVLEPVLRQADVLHVQFPFWLGIRAAGLARKLGTPVVAASHLQPENMFHNVGIHSEWVVDWTWRFFIASLYGRADFVVSPTAFGLQELRRRGLSVPAEVVSNGIPPQFHPGPAERDPRYGDRFVVLAVSRLAKEKRIDVIIEAVRRSRNASRIQLVVYGRGPEEDRLRTQSATLPVPAEISLVEEEDMPRLMRAADLLVHASEIELEGMAVLEALGIGLPTLVADAPMSAAGRLAISDEFRFQPGNAEELARRIDHLIEHPERLGAARQANLSAAEGLRLEASIAKMEAIYQKLAAARSKERVVLPEPTTGNPAAQ
jgi:1,2-diacylglycerol 3-alpha-glucosyltransferase